MLNLHSFRGARLLVASLLIVLGLTGVARAETQTAIFAGGCFWCVESDFDKIPGVLETVSGYIGGTLDNPTYNDVTGGGTGHYEAVRIRFDPAQVRYDALVAALFRSVDVTDDGGQFCDRGESYRTAIFALDSVQRAAAEAAKIAAAEELGRDVVTPVLDAATFYEAEDYHQDFYLKSPNRYRIYRWSCGRDQRVKDLWGDNAYAGIPGKE